MQVIELTIADSPPDFARRRHSKATTSQRSIGSSGVPRWRSCGWSGRSRCCRRGRRCARAGGLWRSASGRCRNMCRRPSRRWHFPRSGGFDRHAAQQAKPRPLRTSERSCSRTGPRVGNGKSSRVMPAIRGCERARTAARFRSRRYPQETGGKSTPTRECADRLRSRRRGLNQRGGTAKTSASTPLRRVAGIKRVTSLYRLEGDRPGSYTCAAAGPVT